MRYAFSTLACPNWTSSQIVDGARSLGYAAVELRVLEGRVIDAVTDRLLLQRFVRQARNDGVEVCALGSSCTLNHADPSAPLEDLRHWITLAHDLQVPIVRVFGGDAGPGPAAVSAALQRMVSEAEAAGVVIAIETHDTFSSAAAVAAALAPVPSPAAAALWDAYHTFEAGDEEPEEAARLLHGRIAHVHIKDGRRLPDGSWQLTLLGEGDLPLERTLRALGGEGYDSYLSVEWEKKWHPELAEPEVALPQHIEVLRTIERSLG